MGSQSEDDQFFDSKEYVSPISDSGSDGVDISDSESRAVDDVAPVSGYEVWIRSPGTINERRQKLFKLMGLAQNDDFEDDKLESPERIEGESVNNTKIMERNWSVLRSRFQELRSSSLSSVSSSLSSVSSCSSDTQDLFDLALEENLVRRIRDLDDETEYVVDDLGQDGFFARLREAGSEKFERFLGLSPLGKSAMRRDASVSSNKSVSNKRAKKKWLQKMGVVACVAETAQEGVNYGEAGDSSAISRDRAELVKVRTYRKRSKEYSGLYMGQNIAAHKGAILTMKFSLDGQVLASAGEDEIIRIWQVIEAKRSDLVHVPDVDSSHVYFAANHLGELELVNVNKSKKGRLKSLSKSWESACVIFPRNVFQLEQKPLHEFQGHCGEILDLSWSISKVSGIC